MQVAIGCDHRGLELKTLVIRELATRGHLHKDFGCYTPEPVDYPDIAIAVANAVAGGGFHRGILICDSGIGMSIVANKVKGIRAALCNDAFYARRARQHNDANILCVAAGAPQIDAPALLDAFLNTSFEGGRHERRLNKISAIEG